MGGWMWWGDWVGGLAAVGVGEAGCVVVRLCVWWWWWWGGVGVGALLSVAMALWPWAAEAAPRHQPHLSM